MASQFFESRDEKSAGLHEVTAVIAQEIAQLQSTDTETLVALRASWGELLKLLDLQPAHVLRNCPNCGHVGMRAATRCGHCWVALVPPPATTVAKDPV